MISNIITLLTNILAQLKEIMKVLKQIRDLLAKEEPNDKHEESNHWAGCFSNCLCLSCARDHGGLLKAACCAKHGHTYCIVTSCPEYTKELSE